MKGRKNVLWKIFLTFLKIGAFTFGGGYAMIPLIQKETVERHGWISEQDILDIVAIAESTPGPIAVNSATFVGYKVCGFWGALCATLGVVLPSFTVITCIAFVLREFQQLAVVRYAFFGIRAGVLALILKALWSMYRQCPKNAAALGIAAASFLFAAVFHLNVLLILIGCALTGLAVSTLAFGRENL